MPVKIQEVKYFYYYKRKDEQIQVEAKEILLLINFPIMQVLVKMKIPREVR